MIIDTSAVVAIARAEPDAERYVEAMRSSRVGVSTATVLECAFVLRPALADLLDELLHEAQIEVIPFDAVQLAAARTAMAAYGRGSGSPAKLNYGDCISYALAKTTQDTLLFKGDDFRHTDIEPALVD